jgi:hypothetical protein
MSNKFKIEIIEAPMINETKQTAVEQFAIVLYQNGFLTGNGDEIQELLEKAKEMEKEQIAEAYWNGSDGIEDKTSMLKIGENYYNETYGGNQ